MIKHSKMLNKCYITYDQKIALHFPSFYSTWASLHNKNTGKRGEILADIRNEPYYIKDNVLKRVNGTPMRVLILSTDPKDSPPQQLLDFITPPVPNAKGLCSCSTRDLFNSGCKCGGK